jgi:hypothetical protein
MEIPNDEIQNDEKIVINQLRHVPEVWNKYMRDYNKNRIQTDEEYRRKKNEKAKETSKKIYLRKRAEKIANGHVTKLGRKKGGKNKPKENEIVQ